MWVTVMFHTRRCHRGVAPSLGGKKPEGRLRPRIPVRLSSGVQWVICISPFRHSHPDPAALCTWWNGSQSCCLDNRSLDYRLCEWRERERETKRKGVIVRIRGHLTSCWFFCLFVCFNSGQLIKNCFRPGTMQVAVNQSVDWNQAPVIWTGRQWGDLVLLGPYVTFI